MRLAPAILLLRLDRSASCGSSWDAYILAPSGAHDCSGCGESISSYEACALAAESGATHLEIGGLGDSESWSGPPGCHIQEGSNFQWNANEGGDNAEGHTPVCIMRNATDESCGTDDYCTIEGVLCPADHQDADMGDAYAVLSTDRWMWRGSTSDGRPWFETTSEDSGVRYLYYSDRAEGYFLTGSEPELDLDDPWLTDNNYVRLYSGSARLPDGLWPDARLYCGHDTGPAAEGCSSHTRDTGEVYYWCDNYGTISVSCTCASAAVSVSSTCACAQQADEQPRFSFHSSPLSWHAAREDCQSRGGDLASIHSAAENREAYALTGGRDTWLGLNGEDDEDNYVWSDGTPFDYDAWAEGEPNNHDGDEDCGGYWSGRAHDEEAGSWDTMYGAESCGGNLAYLCRYEARSSSGSRYTYHAGPLAYGNAIEACQESGGNLATIRSQADQDAAFAVVPAGARAYIGLNDRDSEGSFVWVDGSAVSYTNWGPNEPNSFSGTNEDCAGFHVYYPEGEWNDFPCGGTDSNDGNVAIGYVCEEPAVTSARRRLSEVGPVEVSSSCASYNCYEASHIPGHDITCDTGMSQAQCAELCCSEAECLGFDFSEADSRCCTGSVSRADGPFEYNGGSYLSCEKNDVTELSSRPLFVYHSGPETWEGARAVCQAEGGDLASIHNAEENALAHAAIDQASHASYHDGTDWPGTWIGLNDRSAEGSWVWSDESPTDFIAFQENEPNQGTNENCGFYYFDFGAEWADVNCEQRIGFLCRTAAASLFVSSQGADCECLDYTSYGETADGPSGAAIAGAVGAVFGALVFVVVVGLMIHKERKKTHARRMRERTHAQAGVQIPSTASADPVVAGEPLQAAPVAVAQVVYAEPVNAYPTIASPAYPTTASLDGYPLPAYSTQAVAAVASSSAATSMPPLSEACEVFKRELGVSGARLVDVVDATCELLGIKETTGLSLVQRAERCWTMIKG